MIEPLASSSQPLAELQRLGLTPSSWGAGPAAFFAAHRHPRTKRLFVVRGSIVFCDLDAGGAEVALGCGEGIRIAAGTEHEAVAGPDGVECVEAFEGDPVPTAQLRSTGGVPRAPRSG